MSTTANGVAPVDYALKLREAGISVLPVCRQGTKAPDLDAAPKWGEFQQRIPSPAEIQIWHRNGDVGTGIICGRVSGGLEVIDFDDRETGDQALERLKRIAPELVEQLTIHRTPKGYHWFIRSDYVQGNQKLAKDATGKQTLVETRGEGGYVVSPHSPLDCHPSREPYTHISGPPVESVGKFTAEERETILRIGRSFNQYTKPQHEPPQQPQQRGEGLSPGDDFNQRATWQSILEPHGWREIYPDGWRRPGKTSGSISASTSSRSQSGKQLLCVFSSNAEPLESETNYDKFGAYTWLNHGGVFRDATKALAAEGYGDPPRRHSPPPNPGKGLPDLRPAEFRNDPEENAAPERPGIVWMSSVEAEQTAWLWDRRIPAAAITIIDGDPGLGKSQLTMDLTARLTRGNGMPPSFAPNGTYRPTKVLILSAEDHPAQTLRPRLDAAGADCSKVALLRAMNTADGDNGREIVFPLDTAAIADLQAEHKFGMIIIDPLAAHAEGKINLNNDADSRRLLRPLATLAEQHNVAIVIIRHLNKKDGSAALYRGGGSIGIVGAARAAHVVGLHPENPEQRILACIKSNLGPWPKSMAFEIEEFSYGGITTSRVAWLGECDISAAQMLTPTRGKKGVKSDAAEALILTMLAAGPRPESDVLESCIAAGISERTYRRARKELGIVCQRVGYGPDGAWMLFLPSENDPGDDPGTAPDDWDTPPPESSKAAKFEDVWQP